MLRAPGVPLILLGCMRALDIQCRGSGDTGRCELVETGIYLDLLGNGLRGVEAFVEKGKTYVLGRTATAASGSSATSAPWG